MMMNEIAACFHCGQPVAASADWHVRIEGVERAMCCPGCAAVAQTIVDIGQTSYYRERTGFAAPGDAGAAAALVPAALALPEDDPNIMSDGDARETTLLVEGIRCAACVWLIEHRLRQVDGKSLRYGTSEATQDCDGGSLLFYMHMDRARDADRAKEKGY